MTQRAASLPQLAARVWQLLDARESIVSLLRALRAHCTIVLIAHRATSLQACDELFELGGGRLVGRGALA